MDKVFIGFIGGCSLAASSVLIFVTGNSYLDNYKRQIINNHDKKIIVHYDLLLKECYKNKDNDICNKEILNHILYKNDCV